MAVVETICLSLEPHSWLIPRNSILSPLLPTRSHSRLSAYTAIAEALAQLSLQISLSVVHRTYHFIELSYAWLRLILFKTNPVPLLGFHAKGTTLPLSEIGELFWPLPSPWCSKFTYHDDSTTLIYCKSAPFLSFSPNDLPFWSPQ